MHGTSYGKTEWYVMITQLIKRFANKMHLNRRSNFKAVDEKEIIRVSSGLKDNWKNENIPHLQWKVVEPQLLDLRNGKMTSEFNALVQILRMIPEINQSDLSCLEIGCSSGYYSEVILKYFPNIRYQGCDYSKKFIEVATDRYPEIQFLIEDTTNLSYPGASIDIVISGSVLLHVPDWVKGISETARIARKYMILHRTPVYLGPTKLFTKTAYGSEVIEWSFSKNELISVCEENGFELIHDLYVYENSKMSREIEATTQQSFLFKRKTK